MRKLNARPGTDVRVIEVDERDGEADGTRLFEGPAGGARRRAPERMAGVIAITDGRVHDIPASAKALGFQAARPCAGDGPRTGADRRLEVVQGPRFGIVGRDVPGRGPCRGHRRLAGAANVIVRGAGR